MAREERNVGQPCERQSNTPDRYVLIECVLPAKWRSRFCRHRANTYNLNVVAVARKPPRETMSEELGPANVGRGVMMNGNENTQKCSASLGIQHGGQLVRGKGKPVRSTQEGVIPTPPVGTREHRIQCPG